MTNDRALYTRWSVGLLPIIKFYRYATVYHIFSSTLDDIAYSLFSFIYIVYQAFCNNTATRRAPVSFYILNQKKKKTVHDVY